MSIHCGIHKERSYMHRDERVLLLILYKQWQCLFVDSDRKFEEEHNIPERVFISSTRKLDHKYG